MMLLLAVGILSAVMPLTLAECARAPHRLKEQASAADPSLLLTLSQEQNPEPRGDSMDQKNCLDHYLRLACVLLTLTLKNTGTVTILSFSTSCDKRVWFDLMKSDGSWEPFPVSDNFLDRPVCSRNVLIVQILSPGDTEVWHIRLADLGMKLDALASSGSHTIRARSTISGCVVSDKAKPEKPLNPLTAHSMCVAGKIVQQFAILHSTSLDLTADPPLH